MKIRFFIIFIFLFGCLVSCNNDTVVHPLGKTKNNAPARLDKIDNTKKQKLTSILYELAVSQDPKYFAKKHRIFLDKNRVRVFIFLEPSVSNLNRTKMLEKHEIHIEKSSAHMIRGLVAIDHLMSLVKEPVIQSIRLPDKLIKTRQITP